MFEDFKNKFNKQNKQKKDELKKLFSSSKIKEDNIINIKDDKEKEKMVQIKLSNGEIIKTKLSSLKKFPNSVLAIYINKENNSPKKQGNIFIDRDPDNFKYLLYFLENDKLPNFKIIPTKKNFFPKLIFGKYH